MQWPPRKLDGSHEERQMARLNSLHKNRTCVRRQQNAAVAQRMRHRIVQPAGATHRQLYNCLLNREHARGAHKSQECHKQSVAMPVEPLHPSPDKRITLQQPTLQWRYPQLHQKSDALAGCCLHPLTTILQSHSGAHSTAGRWPCS